MAEIIVTHGIPEAGLEMLAGHRVHYPGFQKVFDQEALLQLLPKAQGMIACGPLSGELIDAGQGLRIIANYGAGYDRVDVAAATRRGIPVANTPDETQEPTAELAVGLILAAARRIAELDSRLRREPSETLFGMGRHMGMGLKGNTLGIVGMGRIGSLVAQFGRLMGMRVLYHNRRPARETYGAQYVPLAELMAASQVVSVHCPLSPETFHLIGARELALMPQRAVLVNTARGPVVDYQALAERLAAGQIMAAGLDVFDQEPQIPKTLLELPNVVLTPHIGTNTREARYEMTRACCRHILDALAGKRPGCVVNPSIYD